MRLSRIVLARTLLWIACLAPLIRLAILGWNRRLGANPIEFITHSTGIWTLVLLLTTLSLTPLRRLTRWNGWIRYRRLLGLFAFFYAGLHFLTYLWLDKFFDLADILKDIAKRPFITAGFIAFLLLLPLALTSSSSAIRRLGGQRWHRLHQLVYFAAAAAVLHFLWKVKLDTREPLLYASVLALLLLARIAYWTEDRRKRSRRDEAAN